MSGSAGDSPSVRADGFSGFTSFRDARHCEDPVGGLAGRMSRLCRVGEGSTIIAGPHPLCALLAQLARPPGPGSIQRGSEVPEANEERKRGLISVVKGAGRAAYLWPRLPGTRCTARHVDISTSTREASTMSDADDSDLPLAGLLQRRERELGFPSSKR